MLPQQAFAMILSLTLLGCAAEPQALTIEEKSKQAVRDGQPIHEENVRTVIHRGARRDPLVEAIAEEVFKGPMQLTKAAIVHRTILGVWPDNLQRLKPVATVLNINLSFFEEAEFTTLQDGSVTVAYATRTRGSGTVRKGTMTLKVEDVKKPDAMPNAEILGVVESYLCNVRACVSH